jgi:hypothetical protein
MHRKMNIRQLIEIGQAHKRVTVEGMLVVGKDSRLMANADDPNSPLIFLPHDLAAAALENSVPVYGGGPYGYYDLAAVTGTVEPNPWRFTAVSRIVIFREQNWVVELQS